MEVSAEDAPVIKLVYSILGQAVGEGASDIHFEPDKDQMRVRFRIDGVLCEAAKVPEADDQRGRLPHQDHERAEHRREARPAGRPHQHHRRDRRVDLRVTTLPTSEERGRRSASRQGQRSARLDELGMEGTARERFEESFRQSYGAVSSPGRPARESAQTLYAALQHAQPGREEHHHDRGPGRVPARGINQINVNRKAGLDFATGLRSILRADPDIVMVGEIRDGETARIAVEAALTGHMMLSTLHTNDAPGGDQPAERDGMETWSPRQSTASSPSGWRASSAATASGARSSPFRPLPTRACVLEQRWRPTSPTGAPVATESGYKGRVGIYSVMAMNERIKEMTVAQSSEAEIGNGCRPKRGC